MTEDIFRKKAIDKISSPEQLDTLIKVSSPINWLLLIALAIVIAIGIFWGIFGKIPTKLKGTGILLAASSITKLESHVTGEIVSLNIKTGDFIKKGQIIARISQPLLEEKIKLLMTRIEMLENNLQIFDALNTANLKKELDYLDKQKANLNKSIVDLTQHKIWLIDRVKKSKGLRQRGAISAVELHKTEKELTETKLNVHKEKSRIQDIVYKKSLSISNLKKAHLQKTNEVLAKKALLEELKFDLKEKSVLISPVSGRILELSVGQNQMVQKGEDFLTLITSQRMSGLEAIVYFPPGYGKKIKYGMDAQVAPLTVMTTKYGFIEGIVENVNIYPSSLKGMENTLQNQELVKKLSAGGAPIKVKISLIPSATTISGLQWTSSKGPPLKVLNGTICTSYVIVKEDSPISFVIPLFRKHILGEEDNSASIQ